MKTTTERRRNKPRRDLTSRELRAQGPVDLPFLMLTLLLLGIGLIMLLSASSYAARYATAAGYNPTEGVMGDPFYFFKHQGVYAILGIVGMLLISRLDYQHLRLLSVPVLLISVFLLVLVAFSPFGVTSGGSTRWLKMLLVAGPTYQPSEIAKLGVVLFFAASLSKRKSGIPEFKRRWPKPLEALRRFYYWSELAELVPYGAILVVIAGLMMVEPHISGTVLVMAAGAAILFAAGIRLGWFVLGGGAAAAAIYVMVAVMGYNSTRLTIWLNPWNPDVDGYQIIQSLYAVASGGLTGLGFGLSRQKYLYLPEEQNDFIFAIVAEELGFVGATLIVILFALLVIRGYWLALHARDRFGSLLIVGIITLLAVQVFLNMAVVTNVIPTTGISLPFFSYGGTALVIQLAEMGIVLAVSRQIPAPKQG